MKKVLFALALAGLCSPAMAVPVFNPANGHYYEYVPTPKTWAAADAAANASSHLGLPGHLVTLTSAAENKFITDTFGFLGTNPWIGLFQPAGSPEPAGGWTWVTGETFAFSNWGPGEPNNAGPETHGQLWTGTTPGAGQNWNDRVGFGDLPYIVEYEAVAAVPEVSSTAVLLGVGLLSLLGLKRRSKVSGRCPPASL